MKKGISFILAISVLMNVILLGYLVMKHYSYEKPPFRITINGRYNIQQKLSVTDSDIVFIGNSLTDLFPVTEMFHNLHVKNRGVTQSNTFELLSRNDILTNGKPKKVFLMDGINDIDVIDEEATFKNIEQVIKNISNLSPKTQVYIESILPVTHIPTNQIIIKYNLRLKDFCTDQGITYINLFDSFYNGKQMRHELTYDGTHITGDGYLLWKKLIEKYVN